MSLCAIWRKETNLRDVLLYVTCQTERMRNITNRNESMRDVTNAKSTLKSEVHKVYVRLYMYCLVYFNVNETQLRGLTQFAGGSGVQNLILPFGLKNVRTIAYLPPT